MSSRKDKFQKISQNLADHRFVQRDNILSGYEDILIGIGDDYKLYSFDNVKKSSGMK